MYFEVQYYKSLIVTLSKKSVPSRIKPSWQFSRHFWGKEQKSIFAPEIPYSIACKDYYKDVAPLTTAPPLPSPPFFTPCRLVIDIATTDNKHDHSKEIRNKCTREEESIGTSSSSSSSNAAAVAVNGVVVIA